MYGNFIDENFQVEVLRNFFLRGMFWKGMDGDSALGYSCLFKFGGGVG